MPTCQAPWYMTRGLDTLNAASAHQARLGSNVYKMLSLEKNKVTETRQPTIKDIQKLVAFLPKLYDDGFEPIAAWVGGGKDKDGVYTLPYPEYNKIVCDFIDLINAQDCWMDYKYISTIKKMDLSEQSDIASASIQEIQALITRFLRGERFCDGFWADMIENGYVRLLLKRLSEIEQELQDSEYE